MGDECVGEPRQRELGLKGPVSALVVFSMAGEQE